MRVAIYGIMSLVRVFRSWDAMCQKSNDLFGLSGMTSDGVRGEDTETLVRPKHTNGKRPIIGKECCNQRYVGSQHRLRQNVSRPDRRR